MTPSPPQTPGEGSDQPVSHAQTAAGLRNARFLTVGEVAVIMRVSKMTIYRLVHSGELTSIRIGRSFRIPEPAVGAYLTAAAVSPRLAPEPRLHPSALSPT
jgi:excisionase family DNA binding protein